MQDKDLTTADVSKLAGTFDLMNSQWAPCRYNCPVHADVRLYIEHAAQGRFGPAIDVIREALPLAAVCGRICHHPCEANCRRNDVDAAVAIREVKRFVAELQGAKGCTVRKAAKQDKARVAIIGGGPAGLSAALELAKKGYRPTIFEKFPIAGGIPATAIPRYRMPLDVLQIDVEWILAHGVELKTGVEIGKDKTIDGLLAEGFAAVLVAVGLAKSRTLPLPGGDHPQVFPVLEFLQQIAFDDKPQVGKSVLVIGGGNVAVDAARSALRLGAASVQMMCLEDEKEMPAWKWEQDEAKEEGIRIIHRRGPVEVVRQGDGIAGLKARKVTRVFDENKRFNPAYDDGDVITINCDTIVLAIGQMPDGNYLQGSGLKLDERSRLTYDRNTHQTNLKNVFACGEIVTPPGSAVEACASGKRAAAAIDMFLSDKDIRIDDTLPPAIDKITAPTAEKVTKVTRNPVAAREPEARKHSFAQFDSNYTPAAALSEARRCMGCGGGAEVLVDKCVACLTCLRVCPFEIPKVTDVARIESSLCQACGMCIAECPNNAIVARSWEARDVVARASAALAAVAGKKVVAYICGHRATAEQWTSPASDGVEGVAEVYLPSLARLGTKDLLKTLEAGASAVVVLADEPTAERYPQATARIAKRVQQAQALVVEAGLKAETMQFAQVAIGDRTAVKAALAAAVGKIGS